MTHILNTAMVCFAWQPAIVISVFVLIELQPACSHLYPIFCQRMGNEIGTVLIILNKTELELGGSSSIQSILTRSRAMYLFPLLKAK